MPRCKDCGTIYISSLGACPKCSTKELMNDVQGYEENEAPMSEREYKVMLIKRWVSICIGVPVLIGLIYVLIYLMQFLRV